MIEVAYIPFIKLTDIPDEESNELLTNHSYFQVLGIQDEVIDLTAEDLPKLASWVNRNVGSDIEKIVVG